MSYSIFNPIKPLENFYVYIYCDITKPGKYHYGPYSFDYEPFYVGKGKDDRALHHIREAKQVNLSTKSNRHKINRIRKINFSPLILIVFSTIDEQEAYETEASIIKIIGRVDLTTGPLTNLTSGGIGGTARIVTIETRELVRSQKLGKPSPKSKHTRTDKWLKSRRGYPRSEELKAILRETNKGEGNPRAKLNIEQVKEIRYILENNIDIPKNLTYKYNVSIQTIRAIQHYRIWKDVHPNRL